MSGASSSANRETVSAAVSSRTTAPAMADAVDVDSLGIKDLKALIALLRDEHGVTVLLIEHDMKLVMSISDHIYVINQGTPLANGSPEQVRNNPDVIKAYLGEA